MVNTSGLRGIATHDNYDIIEVLTEPIYRFDTTEEIPANGTSKVVVDDDVPVTFYEKGYPSSAHFGELHYKDGYYYAVRFGQNYMYPLLKDGEQVEEILEVENEWTPPDEGPFNLITWTKEHPQEVAVFVGIGALGLILISR